MTRKSDIDLCITTAQTMIFDSIIQQKHNFGFDMSMPFVRSLLNIIYKVFLYVEIYDMIIKR